MFAIRVYNIYVYGMFIYGGSIAKAVTVSKRMRRRRKRDKAKKLTHVIKVAPELF